MMGLYLVAAIVSAGCSIPSYSDVSMEKLIGNAHRAKFHESSVEGRKIFYVTAGNSDRQAVLFIHGTPGSWKAFADLLADDALSEEAYMIALDRPGFGQSNGEKTIPSLADQAKIVQNIIKREVDNKRVILVGHSLGGSIAVRLAMDHPDLVKGMVLVAPSLEPSLEKPRWYNKLAASSLINWAVPADLASANEEIMPLEKELQAMLPLWSGITVPVIIIQGNKDKLVSPQNADFAEKALGTCSQILRYPEAGHFLLWKQPDVVRDAIRSLLDPGRGLAVNIIACSQRFPPPN